MVRVFAAAHKLFQSALFERLNRFLYGLGVCFQHFHSSILETE
jgi:hypothetical protein